MSAIPIEAPIVDRPRSRPTTHVRPRPAARPEISVRVRIGTRRRSRIHPLALAVQKSFLFAVVAMVTFSVSSLVGNVLLEQARRDGLSASQRARAARSSESSVRRTLDRQSGVVPAQSWAAANGFVPIDAKVQGPGA